MSRGRKFNILIIAFCVIAILVLHNYYLANISQEINKYAQRDIKILQDYSSEIIDRLRTADSMHQWQDIIDEYDETVVVIEDSSGETIITTSGKEFSLLDNKVQQAFAYDGEAYLIKISAYFLREYLTDTNYFFRFVIMAILIAVMILLILISVVYLIMLRPVYKLYNTIDKYEKGEELKKMSGHSETAMLQNRFVDMTETINKQQQNQRRIIASISHDIKTPLTSIMGYAELLKKDNISPEREARYLNTIYQKATHIRDLIDDFDEYLSYNMASELKKAEMPVEAMMLQLTESYSDELEPLGVKFIYRHRANNDIVNVDIQKMRRVIGNIISNSLKHFDSDKKIIEVTSESTDDIVKIVIADNGTGVEEDKQEVVFEPLYTSDEGRKVAGLGLAICKEIIESHGGEIYAERSVYGGLAIVIKLKKVK